LAAEASTLEHLKDCAGFRGSIMYLHRVLIAVLAGLVLLQMPTPVQASEVVKLARLVLTGKRTLTEAPREQSAPSSNEKAQPAQNSAEAGTNSAPEIGSGNGSASLSGAHGNHVFFRAF